MTASPIRRRSRRRGRIVAFTVGLSKLSTSKSTQKTYIHFLDQTYGGTAQVAVTVLRPVGKHTDWRWQVIGTSNVFHVIPYLGSVVQLPLESSIEVKPGDVVALTTPTWVPVLTIDQDSKKFAYRQSRSANCNNPPSSSQAQMTANSTARYSCNYPGHADRVHRDRGHVPERDQPGSVARRRRVARQPSRPGGPFPAGGALRIRLAGARVLLAERGAERRAAAGRAAG